MPPLAWGFAFFPSPLCGTDTLVLIFPEKIFFIARKIFVAAVISDVFAARIPFFIPSRILLPMVCQLKLWIISISLSIIPWKPNDNWGKPFLIPLIRPFTNEIPPLASWPIPWTVKILKIKSIIVPIFWNIKGIDWIIPLIKPIIIFIPASKNIGKLSLNIDIIWIITLTISGISSGALSAIPFASARSNLQPSCNSIGNIVDAPSIKYSIICITEFTISSELSSIPLIRFVSKSVPALIRLGDCFTM